MNIELNDVELFFLRRALEWRIQNIDYVIDKKKLEGLKKANYLSEKATLMAILQQMKDEVNDDKPGQPVAVADPEEQEDEAE